LNEPWFIKSSIAASGSATSPGHLPLVRARTITITVRLTCGASLDADPTVEVFYSPDGTNVDTVPYSNWDITYTAGSTVQYTSIVDPPEHGFLSMKVVNNSSADTLTDVKVWYSIQAYALRAALERGTIIRDVGEETEAY
jgi:hypothetical protein